jgi:hypothetical protein
MDDAHAAATIANEVEAVGHALCGWLLGKVLNIPAAAAAAD